MFNSICGQYYKLGSNNSLIQKSDTLYIFSETLSKMDLKTKRIVNSNIEIKFPDNFNLTNHTPFILKDKIVFLNKSSGLLYEYKNDSVIRIDNSYDNKTHNNSLDFIDKQNCQAFMQIVLLNSRALRFYLVFDFNPLLFLRITQRQRNISRNFY